MHDPAVPSAALTTPTGTQQQRGDAERREQPAAPQPERRDDGEQDRVGEERALGADERDQQQRRAERAEQRADRRDRVHPPGGLARVLDALELQPDRPRRHGAEHQHRDGDEREHAEQRAGEAADRDVVERVDREREQRLREERHEREQHRRHRARAGTAPACAGGGRPAARRTSSRSRARPARPRSCSPTRSSSRRSTGAISRAAAISAPRVETPTTKTSNPSGGRRWFPIRGPVWRGRFPTGPGASVRPMDTDGSPISTAPTSGIRSPSSAAGSRRRRS